ncbi:DUF6265 family protein [Terricaulis silvestris]|uniref:DUF6265 domain-containing protein n=1 Tax=Terricaulis silvestris TaxID=2686094 RepID=A0A6I6MGA5_9CAUL|nr:DUF6265 family protein [Terricaulis silvestris]QGZ93279.1 hypothetical protein DSM104635_00088 [Terricaulis silvestris]
MRILAAIGFALGLSACGVSAQGAASTSPDWISGYWLSCVDGRETAESWIGAGTGTLLGANSSGGGFEFLRIAANEDGGLSYYSMPNGASPPTAFAMTSYADQRVVFENPQHDFPQRIVYERDGDVMVARIEGPMDGRTESMEWRFQRAEQDAHCPA